MQKQNCYALFIGINSYQNAQIPKLTGCVRDAQRFLNYLQKNLNADIYNLHVKTLFTGTENLPTRQNIIDHIRQHLGQAKTGDMVLLFYAGHGSKERAHPYFGENNGESQTLVPCDARMETPEGHKIKNILDKEIRYLLYNIWKEHQPEIIFLQDSCHATGSTRQSEQTEAVIAGIQELNKELSNETGQIIDSETPIARFVSPTDYEISGSDWQKLNIQDLAKLYTAFDSNALAAISANVQTGKIPFDTTFPLAEHIHLAACDEHQSAYEIPGKGGVFTCHLLDILEAGQNTISYNDLFNRIRMNIGGVFRQSPDLYVNSPDFKKRYLPFLGDLLNHQKLTPYRDIDIFKGFSPIVLKEDGSWQAKAGEMELLPSLSGNMEPIPVEVFSIDQIPTGILNAVIDYVAADYSKVTFTTANFDKEIYKNKLYIMIPPRFLRRWRVPVCVEATKVENNFKAIFDNLLTSPLLKAKMILIQSKGGLDWTDKAELADYIFKKTNTALELYNKNGQSLFQSSNLDIKQAANEVSGKLIDFLNKTPRPPRSPSIKLFYKEEGSNPFIIFQQEQAKTLAYYDAFINWTTFESADYQVKTESKGFAVYPIETNKENQKIVSAIPAFQKTNSLSQQEAFKLVLGLQRISKWKTVLNIHNKLQTSVLSNYQFDFCFKFKNQSKNLESWNSAHYKNQERGELVAITSTLSEAVLQIDIDINYRQGKEEIYISTLLLDNQFGVLPLQINMGNNLLKPNNKLEIKKVQFNNKGVFYVKIFMAYRRFDISGLLQDPLPKHQDNSQEPISTNHRNRVQKPPKTEETGAWFSFLIPIEII